MKLLRHISSACMASKVTSLCHRFDQSNLYYDNLPLSVHYVSQKIFYCCLLAYFNVNIVQSFAVTNVNFSFLCLCCKPESWNLCKCMKSKKSCIHFSSIHTAILLLVIITGASIVIDFLPDRAIVYLFTLPRYIFYEVGTHRIWSVTQWYSQHLS